MPPKREMNGWLRKRPNKGNIGSPYRRWFVLESPILSWYTSELEHDQKGFATLTKYSTVAQLAKGTALGPNFEVTANSEQIFVCEAASAEEATEWVLALNETIKRLRVSGDDGGGGGGSGGAASESASDFEKKLMEQAMAETRRMEQLQRVRRETNAQSQAELQLVEAAQREAVEAAGELPMWLVAGGWVRGCWAPLAARMCCSVRRLATGRCVARRLVHVRSRNRVGHPQ
jgi:hypothetical protein